MLGAGWLGAEILGAGWLGAEVLGVGLTVPAPPPCDVDGVFTLLPPRLATYVVGGVGCGAGIGAAMWLARTM